MGRKSSLDIKHGINQRLCTTSIIIKKTMCKGVKLYCVLFPGTKGRQLAECAVYILTPYALRLKAPRTWLTSTGLHRPQLAYIDYIFKLLGHRGHSLWLIIPGRRREDDADVKGTCIRQVV